MSVESGIRGLFLVDNIVMQAFIILTYMKWFPLNKMSFFEMLLLVTQTPALFLPVIFFHNRQYPAETTRW